jgi:hypothetical protein
MIHAKRGRTGFLDCSQLRSIVQGQFGGIVVVRETWVSFTMLRKSRCFASC